VQPRVGPDRIFPAAGARDPRGAVPTEGQIVKAIYDSAWHHPFVAYVVRAALLAAIAQRLPFLYAYLPDEIRHWVHRVSLLFAGLYFGWALYLDGLIPYFGAMAELKHDPDATGSP
jgi:hypothetical protein